MKCVSSNDFTALEAAWVLKKDCVHFGGELKLSTRVKGLKKKGVGKVDERAWGVRFMSASNMM